MQMAIELRLCLLLHVGNRAYRSNASAICE
jgi:hypothetical protein